MKTRPCYHPAFLAADDRFPDAHFLAVWGGEGEFDELERGRHSDEGQKCADEKCKAAAANVEAVYDELERRTYEFLDLGWIYDAKNADPEGFEARMTAGDRLVGIPTRDELLEARRAAGLAAEVMQLARHGSRG